MADAILCPACGTGNDSDRKFCGECGTPLARVCATCGASNPPTVKFCGECGTALVESTPAAAAQTSSPTTPVAERRLVSVLFADLVGHTTFSAQHDAEDVRELLSRYFETARTIIERYGGTVEKFIGDAVMALWGAPVAREDDAERAVRAALELAAAVTALGNEVGTPELRARAGVLSGEAAVTLGAEGQGMVAGDLVNTASRVQSAADPGAVLVGEATKRAAEAAIVFEDAGEHTLKGKSEPLPLWRAVRVVGLRGGLSKSTGLEPPFVGRDRELRLVKELFHASAEDRRGNLVSVIGIGGIGKSRLAWEFEKYIDGLAGDVMWHSGRCLAYGDGVAFWALAEMVRGRAGIVEDEEASSARTKLRAAIEEYVPDPQERRFVEPRLGHLLGLEEGAVGDQENLFAAARMFFERVTEHGPTVLLFEDIHWADSALLDFIEYLIEWSRDVPLFVLTLARPELTDRRPTWGSGKRNFTSIFLEPLSPDSMEALLTGPVPGLSEELRARILERAEGVPFYAVETVRMLLDRGILVREGTSYRLTGEVETLEVPETLHALIAARLDGLTTDERRIVQQASVLGRTFTLRGLASLSASTEAELEPLLTSLVRKEVVSLSADPLSPERGQYGFLQDLVKKVAYDTLSRRERKTLHLGAAEYLRALGDEDEVVEVLAAHYVDAYRAEPDDLDAAEIRTTARDALVRAAERAASLAASEEAQHAYERAVELSDDPLEQADLHEHAGLMARTGARSEQAAAHYEQAIALFESSGATHPAARVSARLAEIMWDSGRLEQGLEIMDRSFRLLTREEPDDDLGTLAAQLGRFMFFAGQHELASQRIETALDIAEALSLPEVLAQALTTKGMLLTTRGRKQEGLAVMRFGLTTALEHDKPSAALRASYNLADTLSQMDRYDEAVDLVREGLAHARRVGNRYWEWSFLGQVYPLFAIGAWDEALEMTGALPEEQWRQARQAFGAAPSVCVLIHVHRGNLDEAARMVELFEELATSADIQERAVHTCGKARLLLAEGRPSEVLVLGADGLELRTTLGYTQEFLKELHVTAAEAALSLGDTERVEELVAELEALPLGTSSQFLQAQSSRFRAHLAAQEGDATNAERLFKGASGLFRELAFPFYFATMQLEYAEWLGRQGRNGELVPVLTEARQIFDQLGARPMLDRAEQITGVAPVPA
jgi:class 3 adenylate cyclase/tetratricopeptide (TPR) repeat protein